MSVMLQLRSAPSGAPFKGENQDDTVLWDVAAQAWYVGPGGGGGAVDSVFGRTGVVVAATGDYDSDQVDNISSVPGASVSDALEYLLANAGAVDSVFGRTGAVVAATGDYDSDQVDNVSNVPGASVSDASEALIGTVFDLSGATITLTTAHRLAYIRASHTSGCQVVVVAADWQVGDYCLVEWSAAGQPTITAGSGTTLHQPSLKTLALAEQYAVVGFKCVASGVFTVFGNLADA